MFLARVDAVSASSGAQSEFSEPSEQRPALRAVDDGGGDRFGVAPFGTDRFLTFLDVRARDRAVELGWNCTPHARAPIRNAWFGSSGDDARRTAPSGSVRTTCLWLVCT